MKKRTQLDVINDIKVEIDEQIDKTVQRMCDGILDAPNKDQMYQSLDWVATLLSRRNVLSRYFQLNDVLRRVGYRPDPRRTDSHEIDVYTEIQKAQNEIST